MGKVCSSRPTVGWSSWSDCSVTCGKGKQTRTKVCLLGLVCLPSSLVGTQTQDCNSSPCPTSSYLNTAYATSTYSLSTSYSPSFTQYPTSMYSSTSYVLSTSNVSPTQSSTSSITTSQPTSAIGNTFFTLSHRGCRYSNVKISRTVNVRNKLHCISICARESECVAFNLDGIKPSDSSEINEHLKCEILEKDYGRDVSLSRVSENCKNYERVTI
ncbi:ectin-like isoform X2 [Actinia tenebrosa]|uniref:Ectin-like isoform X2 n=1 Tax=Actinia tenebrosa TaxID=6105 RepID=A0A6P8J1H3_ACTTE|nr:ectin-like isoform X2 [Actinia tenebrosa]